MFSHVTIGSDDIERAAAFYDAVLAPLGQSSIFRDADHAAYGAVRGARVWIMRPFDRGPARPGNGVHVAFTAPDRAAVDAFYEAAIAAGGTCEGPPGLRQHYHPNYYGAYVRDLDGNKIQAVCHARPKEAGED